MILLPPANEVVGRLCFYTCLLFCSQGGWYPSMHCRSPGPHPGGKLRDLAWGGGLQAHTRGYPSMHWGRHPQQMATAAGGTHPTEMHPCLEICTPNVVYIYGCWNNIQIENLWKRSFCCTPSSKSKGPVLTTERGSVITTAINTFPMEQRKQWHPVITTANNMFPREQRIHLQNILMKSHWKPTNTTRVWETEKKLIPYNLGSIYRKRIRKWQRKRCHCQLGSWSFQYTIHMNWR